MASAQPFPIPPKNQKKISRSRVTKPLNQFSDVNPRSGKKNSEFNLNLFPMNNQLKSRQLKSRKQETKQRQTGKSNQNQSYHNQSDHNQVSVGYGAKVEQLQTPKQPLWLQGLISLHFMSSCTTFLLITAALGVYGWTVYTQQSWGRSYRYLESLQRNERQLTATNEIIKNDLALEAENPQMGLVNPDPNATIFLKPADAQLKSPQSLETQEDTLEVTPANSNIPLGY